MTREQKLEAALVSARSAMLGWRDSIELLNRYGTTDIDDYESTCQFLLERFDAEQRAIEEAIR